ncbi:MAG: transposase [Cyanobacteriota bacterium]
MIIAQLARVFIPEKPWPSTARTRQKLLKVADALWTFLETEGIEPTNNAAERALRPAVIQRKVSDLPSNSHGVQWANGAICSARLLAVTTTLRQQERDVWQFLEQAWIIHHHGGVMPSLLPDRSAMSRQACRHAPRSHDP